jgi:redox-sensitive bicupin YhaK (pirin superfamily)
MLLGHWIEMRSMWWNFVARTPEEIAHARADWEKRQRFDPAPRLSRIARPNPAS